MRKSHKDQLFEAAFKLFLTRHLDGISITDIEKISGMTRGAIFYHVKSKEELFKEVIKYFILEKQNIKNKIPTNNPESFKDFLIEYIEGVEKTMKSMQDIIDELSLSNASRGYLSLILDISSYDDLAEHIVRLQNNETSKWVTVLYKSIESNEIRSDIDVMKTAKHFQYIFYGLSYINACTTGLKIENLKEQFMNLYDLIKNN